jgi:hypothetical protein
VDRVKPYLKHHCHPEVYEPTFERYRNLNIPKPFLSIALLTQVLLEQIYRWPKEFRLRLDWRPNQHQALPNRRIFTKSEEREITEYVMDDFIYRHVTFTLEIVRIIVDRKRQEIPQVSAERPELLKMKFTRSILSKYVSSSGRL